MKIICTVSEFGELVRQCEHATCKDCLLKNVCDGSGVESLVSAENIVPGEWEDKEDV